MASLPSSPHCSSTSTRDYLFRALYIRREMALLATYSRIAAPASAVADVDGSAPADDVAAAAPATEAATGTAHDVLLLPPLYGLDGLTLAPCSGDAACAVDPMLMPDHAWSGLVHVRAASSPWYRGCFAFHAYFPSRYPFEPPIIELAAPLRSHPLVQERRVQHLGQLGSAADHRSDLSVRATTVSDSIANASTAASPVAARRVFVPFEDVYAAVDPMRVSVMAALLRHMQLFFQPAEWPDAWRATPADAAVNRVLARRDVERCSVTQEVLLLRPFEQYVGTEVMEHFLDLWHAGDGSDDTVDTIAGEAADWYTREVLPHLLHS
ncbi:Ubiquitin-conjugating enzyme [Novymonas esmeraldas]|uniref:Ubiquitin-conjugating enzyme n=1 Tax=Novymonas esmeraldas TaxID=1808958 RepID=A0AAW0EVT6_9TRYP